MALADPATRETTDQRTTQPPPPADRASTRARTMRDSSRSLHPAARRAASETARHQRIRCRTLVRWRGPHRLRSRGGQPVMTRFHTPSGPAAKHFVVSDERRQSSLSHHHPQLLHAVPTDQGPSRSTQCGLWERRDSRPLLNRSPPTSQFLATRCPFSTSNPRR
jgi:hypothetical protein